MKQKVLPPVLALFPVGDVYVSLCKKKELTLHLARDEGRERYFSCNLMPRKVFSVISPTLNGGSTRGLQDSRNMERAGQPAGHKAERLSRTRPDPSGPQAAPGRRQLTHEAS